MSKIKISYPMLFLLCATFMFCQNNLIFVVLLSVAMHELGHIMAIKMFGGEIEQLNATISGLKISYLTKKQLSYKADLLIACAGAMMNIVVIIAGICLSKLVKSEYVYLLVGTNALLAIFNLLPAMPLDGGNIVSAALALHFGYEKSICVVTKLSLACGFALLAFGSVIFVLSGGNCTLMVGGAYILITLCNNCSLHNGNKKLLLNR